MRSAVVNSTPIISLDSINRLDLLEKLYGKIYIPYAVYEEVCVDGDDVIDKNHLSSFSNFTIEKVSNIEAKKYFRTSLHKGEIETMILANELRTELCIIDDQVARNYAKFLGLKVTGTLGVLVRGKRNGLVEKVVPLMDALIQNGIYISTKLYADIQRISGEWMQN